MTPYLFQTLREENYGLVSLAFTLTLLFGMLVNYGFHFNIPQKLALLRDNTEEKEQIINELICTRLFLSFVMVVIIWLCSRYLGLFQGYSIILVFSTVQLLNDALYPMFILQGFDRLSWLSKANAVSKLLYVLLVVMFIDSPEDAKWVNFILGGSGFVVHGGLLVFIYRAESIKPRWVEFKRIKYWLTNNFQFFFSTVAGHITVNGGTIILKSFVDNTELGYYALTQRVAILLRTVPVFITQAIIQNATRLYADDRSKFDSYLKNSQRNGLIITFMVCFLLAITSKWVVRILAGEYIPLSSNLLIILSALPFLGMFNVSNMIRVLVAEEKYILSKANWITAVFMVIICSIGSYYHGSYGLAFALVIVEIFNFLILHYYLVKRGLK